MGKIIKDKYPELDEEDQEAVRQHAIAALNLTQQAKQLALGTGDAEQSANTALIDGVRKFAMDVRELDIDLIDRINPFGEAYAILAKTMSEDSLKQVAAVDCGKAHEPDAGGSEGTRHPGLQIQEGARTAPLSKLDGCVGETDGRRRGRLCSLQG